MVKKLFIRHFRPVFEWFGFNSTDIKIMVAHSKTRPFVNWTSLDYSKNGLVRYSDGYCIEKQAIKLINKQHCPIFISGNVKTTVTSFLNVLPDADSNRPSPESLLPVRLWAGAERPLLFEVSLNSEPIFLRLPLTSTAFDVACDSAMVYRFLSKIIQAERNYTHTLTHTHTHTHKRKYVTFRWYSFGVSVMIAMGYEILRLIGLLD